jgi:hypothetical protein
VLIKTKVKLAPSFASCLGFVLVFQPLALAEDLQARAVDHQMDMQAFIVPCPIRDVKFLLGYLVPSVGIELVRHQMHPGSKNNSPILANLGSMQQSRWLGLASPPSGFSPGPQRSG